MFWDDLMDEMGVVTLPGGWTVPKDQVYEGFKYARTDETFDTERSRFDNGKVVVGEIVEESGLPELTQGR